VAFLPPFSNAKNKPQSILTEAVFVIGEKEKPQTIWFAV
jgi:hypothetical protein